MRTPLVTSRFRAIYLGIASLCLFSLAAFSLVLTSFVGPKILQLRVGALESLVSSQRDALLFNDNRVLRDELLRERVIARDQQFEEIRIASVQDRRKLNELLLQCEWRSAQVCVGSGYTVVLSEPNHVVSPSFAVLLRTKVYSSVAGIKIYEWLGLALLVLLFSFGAWTIRRQEKFLLDRIRLLVRGLSRIEDLFRLESTNSAEASKDEFSALSVGLERLGELLLEKTGEISGYRKTIEERARSEQITKSAAEMGRVASQVAHDIRSPLAALTVLEKDLVELPEEKRIMLRGAIHRIRDIASDLLKKNRLQENNAVSGENRVEPCSTELLCTLLSTIVTEKRLQYRSKIGIEIEHCFGNGSYGIFSEIQSTEFKRLISNLVNNSVEAIQSSGFVRIRLDGDSRYARISIEDSGRGIAEDILPRLMQHGETHGKSDGFGLGLHHAKKAVESWNGKISIASTVGKGTVVTLLLPRVLCPRWFVPELVIGMKKRKSQILILDDDASIHRIWSGRIEPLLNANDTEVDILHFSQGSQLREWIEALGETKLTRTEVHFLIDYELSAHENGLELIEELGIRKEAVLVTSRFDEQEIRDRCEALGIRMIPKPMVAYLPISLAPTTPGLQSKLTETTLSAASPG